jgi:threonylcarbamoyladenosine tRNA methylthiotransferase MtaB
MINLFRERGYEIVDSNLPADIFIVNTCSVTNASDKKSRQLIRRAIARNPDAFVIVCGCYARLNPDKVSQMPGVRLVLGLKDRSRIVDMIEGFLLGKNNSYLSSDETHDKRKAYYDPFLKEEGNVFAEKRTRAYVKIQDGCDNYCSYCVIPFARGPARSRLPVDIMAEIQNLARAGYKEIVLTGIHAASYGKDLTDTKPEDLIRQAHDIEGIERIRLSSVEPRLITQPFMETLTHLSKFCDHFHLSLQSGCDDTLRRMNRKYTTEQYMRAVELIRSIYPRVGLTTDMIAGFPGETNKEFEESFHFAQQIGFMKVHVFPYSKKDLTAAGRMQDQIEEKIKTERAARLIQLSDSMGQKFLNSFIGDKLSILFEKKTDDHIFEGHSTNYIKVKVESFEDLRNTIKTVEIVSISDRCARGNLIQALSTDINLGSCIKCPNYLEF